MTTWNTELYVNGELHFKADLTNEQIKKLNKYAEALLKPKTAGGIRAVSVALSQAGRFMKATYKGEDWTTDGYLAIRGAEFKPTKKAVVISDRVPDLTPMVAPTEDLSRVLITSEQTETTLNVTSKSRTQFIAANYHKAVMRLHPNAELYQSELTNSPSPVHYMVNGEVVAILMPLKG